MKDPRVTLIMATVFLTINLYGCSMLLSPITPFMANSMQAKHSQLLKKTPPQVSVIEKYQLATVDRIAVMPFENLFGDDKVTHIPFFPKDWGVSGTLYLSNKRNGILLSEYIEEGFLKLKVVDVVERSRLKYVLQEQALFQTGIAKEAIPEVVAATAGADAILVGVIFIGAVYFPDRSLTKHSARLGIKARLIDTRNGRILMTLSDLQTRTSYNPDDIHTIYDDISNRAASSISEVIKNAREANPNAKPPVKADFLSNNRIK